MQNAHVPEYVRVELGRLVSDYKFQEQREEDCARRRKQIQGALAACRLGLRERYLGGYFGGDRELAQDASSQRALISSLEAGLNDARILKQRLDKSIDQKIGEYLRQDSAEYARVEEEIRNLTANAAVRLEVSETDLSFFNGTYNKRMQGSIDDEGHISLQTTDTDLSFFEGTYPVQLDGKLGIDGVLELGVGETSLSFFGGTFPKVMTGRITSGRISVRTSETDLSFFKGTYVKRMEGELFYNEPQKAAQYTTLQSRRKRLIAEVRELVSQ